MAQRPAAIPGEEALAALSVEEGWRLAVLFGSAVREGPYRDVDIAVLPSSPTDLWTQGRWQAALEEVFAPLPVDLLLLHPDLSPVTRYQVFRDGRCLFEARPGLWEAERDRAFFLHADSEHFRRQQREHARGGP